MSNSNLSINDHAISPTLDYGLYLNDIFTPFNADLANNPFMGNQGVEVLISSTIDNTISSNGKFTLISLFHNRHLH